MDQELKRKIIGFIKDYKKQNEIKTDWREPIIGFASAKNPIFLQLKQVVLQDHKLPQELLKNAKTIIAYFIPFNEKIVLSNTKGKDASKKWAIAYVETNKLITELNTFLEDQLSEKNHSSFKIPPTHNFDKNKLMSYWSHKHVAYIAGLGKFGLHKMLITDMGSCGRLGSIITSAEIEATKRNEREYCLYFQNKSCRQCIDKCIFQALKIDDFDRHQCYDVCLKNGRLYSNLGLSDMCGKCACGVPCSLNNPCK